MWSYVYRPLHHLVEVSYGVVDEFDRSSRLIIIDSKIRFRFWRKVKTRPDDSSVTVLSFRLVMPDRISKKHTDNLLHIWHTREIVYCVIQVITYAQ